MKGPDPRAGGPGENGASVCHEDNLRTTATPAPQTPATAAKTIAELARRFPQTFVAEPWEPHRPLAIGTFEVLAAACGDIPAIDLRRALNAYVRRLVYQQALAAGGPRFDLAGLACGEVTPDQQNGGLTNIKQILAWREAQAATGKTARRAERELKRAASASPPPPPSPPPESPRRLGLSELKAGRNRAAQRGRAMTIIKRAKDQIAGTVNDQGFDDSSYYAALDGGFKLAAELADIKLLNKQTIEIAGKLAVKVGDIVDGLPLLDRARVSQVQHIDGLACPRCKVELSPDDWKDIATDDGIAVELVCRGCHQTIVRMDIE
jgi:sRNA-binding protein